MDAAGVAALVGRDVGVANLVLAHLQAKAKKLFVYKQTIDKYLKRNLHNSLPLWTEDDEVPDECDMDLRGGDGSAGWGGMRGALSLLPVCWNILRT